MAGSGKAAAKIVSRKLVWAFLTGNLFTGEFVRVVKFSGAEMYNGVPFHSRPMTDLHWKMHKLPESGTIRI